MSTWSVCSTVSEPPEIIAAFVAHYIALGAAEILLFLDAPDAESIALLKDVDQVKLTICDASYWANIHGKRPPAHIGRQKHNANFAYAMCKSEWMLFCDADEFAWFRHPVGEMLAQIPTDETHRRLRVAERITCTSTSSQSVFDGQFRKAISGNAGRKTISSIYGSLAPMLNDGLTGHKIGKSFSRCHRDLTINIHFPVPTLSTQQDYKHVQAKGTEIDEAWLVHFDALTPLHWHLKMHREYQLQLRKPAPGPGKKAKRPSSRRLQISNFIKHVNNPEALKHLHGLFDLDHAAIKKLEDVKGLVPLHLDIAQTATSFFGRSFDFSPEHINHRLTHKYRTLSD
jgi:hypothetical protein